MSSAGTGVLVRDRSGDLTLHLSGVEWSESTSGSLTIHDADGSVVATYHSLGWTVVGRPPTEADKIDPEKVEIITRAMGYVAGA